MYCGINGWAYVLAERKAPFATTSFKKGVDVFSFNSRVGLFSGDYGTTKLAPRPILQMERNTYNASSGV